MSKETNALKLALEALEYIHEGANNQGPHTGISWRCVSKKAEPAITAIREALAEQPAPPPECQTEAEKTAFAFGWWKALEQKRKSDSALDRMAENARELGLDYEPAQQQKEGFASPGGGYVPAIPRPIPLDWKFVPRKATPEMLRAMDECAQEGYDERLYGGMASSVYMAAWDASPVMGTLPEQPAQQCNPHPKAPHGFDRNASHSADRYVCECEGWDAYDAGYQAGFEKGLMSWEDEQPAQQQEPVVWMYINRSTHETAFQKQMRSFVDHSQWKEVPLYSEPLANHEFQCVCGAVWCGDEMVHLPDKRPQPSKPLTDEQIEKICPKFEDPVRREMWVLGFKAAHGIMSVPDGKGDA